MEAFAYLSVLLSIILGLALTQVLQGYRGLLLARGSVTLHAPTLIWSVLLIVFAMQSWWASFGLADRVGWNFLQFAIVLLQTIFLYMMTALVLPDMSGDRDIDLATHYERERMPFFGFALAMLASSLLKDWLLDGRLPEAMNLLFHLTFAGVAAAAMIVRAPRFHLAAALTILVLIVAYIAVLFARL